MITKQETVHDTVQAFKEAIDWSRLDMGPRNADHLKERVDVLFSEAVQHGIKLAEASWLWAIEEHAKECESMSAECKKKIADKRLYYESHFTNPSVKAD